MRYCLSSKSCKSREMKLLQSRERYVHNALKKEVQTCQLKFLETGRKRDLRESVRREDRKS